MRRWTERHRSLQMIFDGQGSRGSSEGLRAAAVWHAPFSWEWHASRLMYRELTGPASFPLSQKDQPPDFPAIPVSRTQRFFVRDRTAPHYDQL